MPRARLQNPLRAEFPAALQQQITVGFCKRFACSANTSIIIDLKIRAEKVRSGLSKQATVHHTLSDTLRRR